MDYVTSPYADIDYDDNKVILWDDSKTGDQVVNIFLEYISDSKPFSEVLYELIDGGDIYWY